jgi:hypothetical protein
MRTRLVCRCGALFAGAAAVAALLHHNVLDAFAAPVPPHTLLFAADFEGGSWNGLQRSGDGVFELDRRQSHRGAHSARLAIRRGAPACSVRAELVPIAVRGHYGASYARFDVEYWYGFSMLLPADWEVDVLPESIAQWHDVPDRMLFERDRNPPLAIVLRGERVFVEARWDASLVSAPDACWCPGRYDGEWTVDVGGVHDLVGRWCEWVFCVNWSWAGGGRGCVRAWRDGALLVDRQGPNCFRDLRGGPYLKLGPYKWPWTPRAGASAADEPCGGVSARELWVDDVWILRGA